VNFAEQILRCARFGSISACRTSRFIPRPKIMLITSTLLARRKLEKPDRSRFKKSPRSLTCAPAGHTTDYSQPRAHLFSLGKQQVRGREREQRKKATRGINAFCVYPSIVCSGAVSPTARLHKRPPRRWKFCIALKKSFWRDPILCVIAECVCVIYGGGRSHIPNSR
jgi:hypothetical protein